MTIVTLSYTSRVGYLGRRGSRWGFVADRDRAYRFANRRLAQTVCGDLWSGGERPRYLFTEVEA